MSKKTADRETVKKLMLLGEGLYVKGTVDMCEAAVAAILFAGEDRATISVGEATAAVRDAFEELTNATPSFADYDSERGD